VGSTPAFTASADPDPFEATTNSPYLGARIGQLYVPFASDPVDGDLSAAILTFLANGTQISLTGPQRYTFPLGPTKISHTVTNSFGNTAEQNVTIRVVDTTAPNVTVTGAASIVVNSTTAAYDGKVSGPAEVFLNSSPGLNPDTCSPLVLCPLCFATPCPTHPTPSSPPPNSARPPTWRRSPSPIALPLAAPWPLALPPR
jgi:hypothetical protein